MKIGIVIAVIVLVGAVVFFATRKPKPVDKSIATYHRPVAEYSGGKKLIVAFTASWASVWQVTAVELAKLDHEKYDVCILDDAVDHEELAAFGIKFLPTVALVENGKIIKSVQNMMSIDQLKEW